LDPVPRARRFTCGHRWPFARHTAALGRLVRGWPRTSPDAANTQTPSQHDALASTSATPHSRNSRAHLFLNVGDSTTFSTRWAERPWSRVGCPLSRPNPWWPAYLTEPLTFSEPQDVSTRGRHESHRTVQAVASAPPEQGCSRRARAEKPSILRTFLAHMGLSAHVFLDAEVYRANRTFGGMDA
jgi:hypothetical protein